MNAELQKSMQMSDFSSALDSYMLVLLLIMVLTGALGGLANYHLSERGNERSAPGWPRHMTLGVVAALTVPLFLNMISSNLLEAPRTRPVEFFVFGGFCLIYVVASRRLFEGVAHRLFAQVEQMKKDVRRLEERPPVVEPAAAAAVEAPAAALRPEQARDALSYNDVEIVRAIAEESYVYGNLAGLTEKTGLARDMVSNRLTVLKNLGILETRINEKNVLHWFVSAKGKQTLGDILAGQDERKAS